MLVPDFKHQIDAPDVCEGNKAEASRSLRAFVLQDHDVVDGSELLEVLGELGKF